MTVADTTDTTGVYTELVDLGDPNPASLQITVRLVRAHSTRELIAKFGPDMDLQPDDPEVLEAAERLAELVWGDKSGLDGHRGRGRGPLVSPGGPA